MDSGNYQTRYAVMEALGQMGPILSDDRIFKNTTQVNVFKTLSVIPYFVINHKMSSTDFSVIHFTISRLVFQVVHLLITLYKRSGIEPYHVTQCISSLLKAIVDRNSAILGMTKITIHQ